MEITTYKKNAHKKDHKGWNVVSLSLSKAIV